MIQKVKQYISIIQKYIIKTVKISALIVLISNIVFNLVFEPEFRTVEYEISSWLSRILMYYIPLGVGYLIYQTLFPPHKISTLSLIIRSIAIVPMWALFMWTLFFCFFGSYANGSYDECMEMCVAEDLSNYNECSFGTCDFPI